MFLLSAQQFTQKLLSFAGCLKLHNIGAGENILSVNHFLSTHHAQMDLNKMLSTKKKTIQTFKVDAKGFRKTMN